MQFNNADVVSDSSDPLWRKKIYFSIPQCTFNRWFMEYFYEYTDPVTEDYSKSERARKIVLLSDASLPEPS
jgi:hypothetical protein